MSESAVSCEDILGYNVRLYHPESSHRSLTRRVETDKTYYKISDKDIKNKDVKIDHETLIQVTAAVFYMYRHCSYVTNHGINNNYCVQS